MMNYDNFSKWTISLPMILALVSLGCGLIPRLGSSAVEPTPTRTPMPTFTPTPAGADFIALAEEENPTTRTEALPTEEPPSPTPSPSPTPLPTSEPDSESESESDSEEEADTESESENSTTGEASVTILQEMNVRSGPGTNYPIAGPGPAGETSKIIGRNTDSSWVKVEYPSADGTGWLYADLVKIEGDLEAVAVVSAPPPPQPVAVSEPPPSEPEEPAEPQPPPEPEKKYQFTPTAWHASQNEAIIHFKGRIKDEGGGMVNGYSVLLNNGAWSVLSHPTGASHHYPDKGDGEWDVVIPNLADGIGTWTLAVASYDCPNFQGGFDAQCKQYTLLSEEIPITVEYPEETIINADWVCHWDCDKGLYVEGFRRQY